MTKRVFAGLMAFALAAVLGAGVLVASNMGFKLNYTLQASLAGVSNSGTNTIALPDNRQTGVNNAKNLMDDVTFLNVTNVQRFLEATDATETYTGRKSGGVAVPFALNSGEGYFIRMATTTNYIVVGSHNPAFSHTLNQALAGVSNSGTNFFAYPYHSTAANAKQLMDDIGFLNVTNVQRFLKATDATETYTGRKSGGVAVPFALNPGEAYFIRMATTVNYIPSHY
jgi:hypothetical protein